MKQIFVLGAVAMLALTAVYSIITLYDSKMKIGRLHQTPVIRPHEEPLLVMDDKAIAYHQSEVLIKTELLKDDIYPETMPVITKLVLEKGKKDYMAFCSPCHGIHLDGQGTVGQSFHPLPTDLTGEMASKLTDEELFAIISYGSKTTPALASSMSVESRNAVIQYIRSRQKAAN